MPTYYVMYNGTEPFEGGTVPADRIKEFVFIGFRGSNGYCILTNRSVKSFTPDSKLYAISGSADGIHTIRDINNHLAPTPEIYSQVMGEYVSLISSSMPPL
jgi:hypothetical protein